MDFDGRKEDMTKIYNEINQILNQQFQITLAGVAFFGVVLGWVVSDVVSDKGLSGAANAMTLAISTGLLIGLALLFFWLYRLDNVISKLALYLEIQGWSQWEKHHRAFTAKHENKYVNQMRQQAIIFWFLGLFVVLGILGLLYWRDYNPSTLSSLIVFLLAFLGYSVLIYGTARRSWFHDAEKIRCQWKEILGKTSSPKTE